MRAVRINIPPDKSISHRAIMLASISEGTTRIKNLLMAEDCLRTIEAFRAMGVRIRDKQQETRDKGFSVIVRGVGMRGLKKPRGPLYLGNSGTTMRILPGILAGQDFEAVLKGDNSLSKRPMKRIVEPLRRMGAEILGTSNKQQETREIYPPLKIHGGKLKAIKYKSKVASAQVKSCILLAGLYAKGVTSVNEPEKSRDHTERMLRMFGCKVSRRAGLPVLRSFSEGGNLPYGSARSKNIPRRARDMLFERGPKAESRTISIKGPVNLKSPGVIEIPGDISSAAFFIVAGCILPDTKIIIKNVGLNPTRTGVIDILKKMGSNLAILTRLDLPDYEPNGDIIVESSKLNGVVISPAEVVRAIDEIPIIMVAACFAEGETVIGGVGELRVKETDRIKSMVTNLRKIGADVRLKTSLGFARDRQGSRLKAEYIVINGRRKLHGARVSSFGDHRTAMSMLVAGLAAKGRVTVAGLECINKSFPGFQQILKNKFTL